MHPEIQRRVYAEQKQLLGDNFKGEATFQQIADMQYLDMVIKESLRLYPSVPIVARRTDKDYDINGFTVPVDTTINPSTDGYSRHFIGLSQAEQRERLPHPSKYDPILSAVLTLKAEWYFPKTKRAPLEPRLQQQ